MSKHKYCPEDVHGVILDHSDYKTVRCASCKALSRQEEELKIQGAEELFMLIDEEFKSFKISEAMGEVLKKYRQSLTHPEGRKEQG